MKTKMLCLFLSLCLLLTPMTLTAEEERTLVINSEDRFLQFAEDCRLDAYSKGLSVTLCRDLDLTGLDFQGIPQFLGTFDGNHHQISGLQLTCSGSDIGLFRFLEEGSLVENLTVSGTVAPEGSRLNAGGIAGCSKGTIKHCRFNGSVSGVDRAGGIVGLNALTGILEDCQILGTVTGDHFLGGAAGLNQGVIRNCVSRCAVNTSARENKVNVKSLSIETITGTESPSTVTDVGGIAGSNEGVIRDSINRGDVGYPHIGYNIGGIAGSQMGYIHNCQNYGSVWGRKETGGIAGQAEPVARIDFETDTLQILEQQLAGASSLLNRASYNAQSSLGEVGQHLSDMLDSSEDARDAIEQLRPENHPDADTILAAHSAVRQNLHTMYTSIEAVSQNAGTLIGQLGQDLRAVSSQLSAMSQTIRDANAHMGIRLSDVSDQDTEEDLSGKISRCQNLGPVDGDINAGGIVGSIAYENDLDPEDDLSIYGDRSLNFEGSLRCVILDSENRGTITAKKLHAGGIAGWMTMGLVRDCINTGVLDAGKVQYVGGIAGSSHGYIRNCCVKCELWGSSCVGGIAGSGTIVTDCLSMIHIREGSEKLGAILGIREKPQDEEVTEPVTGNLYMTLSRDPGAIDGRSYQGQAEPLAPYKFQALPHLPNAFRQVKLVFQDENGSRREQLILPIGSVFHPENIPAVPEKPGFSGTWEELDTILSQRVYFDKVFYPVYTPHRITIASSRTRENSRPVLLAEGTFPHIREISLEPMALPVPEKGNVLEAWALPGALQKQSTVLHFQPPADTDPELLRILVCRKDGTWEPVSSQQNARHLVFPIEEGVQGFALVQLPDHSRVLWLVGGISALAVLLGVRGICRVVKKKKDSASRKEAES